MNQPPRSDSNPEGCQTVAGGRNAVETSGVRTGMDCTQKGCQKEIARDLSVSPRVDRELPLIRNARGNVGLAPLLGAWSLGMFRGHGLQNLPGGWFTVLACHGKKVQL
jgi:hypothetical protein